ncbi:MAG: porin [Planctomycetes bacterium]|nr:porin [Planctomycetota bacterium]
MSAGLLDGVNLFAALPTRPEELGTSTLALDDAKDPPVANDIEALPSNDAKAPSPTTMGGAYRGGCPYDCCGENPCGGQGCCDNECGDCGDGCDVPAIDPYCRLFRQDRAIRLRGWLDAGILGNTQNPGSSFNGPYNSQEVDSGQFNQAYLIADRLITNRTGLGVGGRVDLLYGGDYNVAQSFGLERNRDGSNRWNSNQYYGLALPQAYGDIGNTRLQARLGHFYSIVGYEGVQSATNFFYSHAYSYQFAGPFTHWGGLGTWQPGKRLTVQAGLVNGWNSLDNGTNQPAFMGGVKYKNDDAGWWSSFAIITGNEQNNPAALATVTNAVANRTRYSFLFSKQIGCRTEYVFHHWLGSQATGYPGGGTALWYGLDQYLYYRINPKWRVGARTEWFRDEGGTRVGLTEPSNPNAAPLPGTYMSWTVGGNWTPARNVVIRPELRWDTYAGSARPFNDGQQTYQLLLGADAIVQF